MADPKKRKSITEMARDMGQKFMNSFQPRNEGMRKGSGNKNTQWMLDEQERRAAGKKPRHTRPR